MKQRARALASLALVLGCGGCGTDPAAPVPEPPKASVAGHLPNALATQAPDSELPATDILSDAMRRPTPLIWGINGHPTRPSAAYSWVDDPERLRTQMRLIQDLGFTHYRVDVGFGFDGSEHGWLAEVADVADQFGITILPVVMFDWSTEIASLKEARRIGRAIGATFVRHHGTRFPVVEIGNELDIRAMRGNLPGDRADHYHPEVVDRYAAILSGIIGKIHAGAPGVRTIVDVTQSHTAFLQLLLDRGVPFDIVGWHAYVNEGDDADPPGSHGDYRSSLARLEVLGRDIWITEVNRRGGSALGNIEADHQAAMLHRLAMEMSTLHPQVKAFLVYELYDQSANLDTESVGDDDEVYYGLVHCTGSREEARDCRGPLERKPAYFELQKRVRADLRREFVPGPDPKRW